MKTVKMIAFFIIGITLTQLSCNKNKATDIEKEVVVADLNIGQPIMATNIIGTNYNPEPRQTDSSPDITADGSMIDMSNPSKHRWVALSRDLIHNDFRNENYPKEGHWQGKFQFGDTINVVHKDIRLCGYWVVHDCMNARYSNRVDFLQGRDGLYGKWEDVTLVSRKTAEV